MFKKLMQIWNEQEFSAKVVNEFLGMISESRLMLENAFVSFTQKGQTIDLAEEIYMVDQKINLTERDIRRRILIHMTTHADSNLSACLALISIVKDAERLGDYVKNIVELKSMLKHSKRDSKLFLKLFDKVGNDILDLFSKVYTAFKNSDKDIALEAMDDGYKIAQQCEAIIDEVIRSNYTIRQSVVLALGSRYMKRIARHLANIASSIVNPLDELDFVGDK